MYLFSYRFIAVVDKNGSIETTSTRVNFVYTPSKKPDPNSRSCRSPPHSAPLEEDKKYPDMSCSNDPMWMGLSAPCLLPDDLISITLRNPNNRNRTRSIDRYYVTFEWIPRAYQMYQFYVNIG